MISLSRYALSYDSRRGVYLIRALEDLPACPGCGRPLRAFGYRIRRVIADDGVARLYEIQRLRCDGCRSVQLWLPSFIMPRKYYDARTIRSAISGSSEACPAEDSTIRRWKHSDELQPVLRGLQETGVVECCQPEKEEEKP